MNVKTLTPKMITLLMDIHEREIMKLPPIDASLGLHPKGLITRKLVTTGIYKKERTDVVSLFLTPEGYNYLQHLQ